MTCRQATTSIHLLCLMEHLYLICKTPCTFWTVLYKWGIQFHHFKTSAWQDFCFGAEREDSHLLAVLWQLLLTCPSLWSARSSLCTRGTGSHSQLQLGQCHKLIALWWEVIPLGTKQNPGQSKPGPGNLNACLWSYLNLCGSRGTSFVTSIRKLCGNVSLLYLYWMSFVCTPFTQNQMHTYYAHRWNTTQRTLSQELFPVLGSL